MRVVVVVVVVSGFREISGPDSRHASKAKLGKVGGIEISFWCKARPNVGAGDVTTEGDKKFIDSC